MVYQHGSPFFDEDEETCRAMHKKAYRSFPISRVWYQAHIPPARRGTGCSALPAKNTIPSRTSTPSAWNKRGIKTWYYTPICTAAPLCCRAMWRAFSKKRRIDPSGRWKASGWMPPFVLKTEHLSGTERSIHHEQTACHCCGGVASVAIQKCCQNFKTFPELCIASRTVAKCDALKAKLEAAGTPVKITTMTVNADDVEDLKRVIRAYQPDLGPECGPAVPGSCHHGCLPGLRRPLHRHRQL